MLEDDEGGDGEAKSRGGGDEACSSLGDNKSAAR